VATYILDFGVANAGATPVFLVFENADTGVAITPPAITERASGQGAYQFDVTWSTPSIETIWYKASVNGAELSATINADTIAAGQGTGSTGAASSPWLWTAGNIINSVAVEVGLDEASDPYASPDKNFVQMRTLLRSVGHELWLSRDWKALIKEATYTGDGTSTLFNLPADFGRMVDDSGWNRTAMSPFDLLSSQGWQGLQAWTSVSNLTVLYRIAGNRMQFFTAPALNEALHHDYVSRYVVISSGGIAPDLYQASASGDTFALEPLMVKALLKVKWQDAKGRDSSAARQEYLLAYEGAASNEPAQMLYLGGPRREFKRIDGGNVPDTGYGA